MNAENEDPSVEVFLPATWRALDLDPATRGESIRRLAAETAEGGSAELVAARRRMQARLEQVAEAAAGAGASLGFVFSTVADGRLASASLIVALIEAADRGEGFAALSARSMTEGLQLRLGGRVDELMAGPGLRVGRRQVVSGATGETSEVEIVQWYVPHEGGGRLAVLTFSTPNVELADQFGEVFDAIAQTTRWVE